MAEIPEDGASLDAPGAEAVVAEPVAEAVAEGEAAPVEVPADGVAAAEAEVGEIKPEASAIEGAAEPVEGEKPAEVVEAAPVYEDWTVPEGLEMQPEQVTAYNEILGKYKLPQEAGQELMEYGGALLKQAQEKMAQAQHDIFNETRRTWVKEFETQAGNRRNTILDDAKAAIRDAVPDEKARSELWNVLAFTGAGDHPAIINMLAAIGKRSRERGAPSPSIASTTPSNPADRRYGGRA